MEPKDILSSGGDDNARYTVVCYVRTGECSIKFQGNAGIRNEYKYSVELGKMSKTQLYEFGEFLRRELDVIASELSKGFSAASIKAATQASDKIAEFRELMLSELDVQLADAIKKLEIRAKAGDLNRIQDEVEMQTEPFELLSKIEKLLGKIEYGDSKRLEEIYDIIGRILRVNAAKKVLPDVPISEIPGI